MIEVKNITKRYGDKRGITDFNFAVEAGEILGFLGPNGAGKTTTMNIMTGYIEPSEGQVLINGIDINENPVEAKRNLGYLPEIPPLYPELQVKSFLKFAGELKGIKKEEIKNHVDEVMELVKIYDVRDRLIKNLSKGYKQRVGLAQAIISKPKIIILDEPTVGLDPKQIIEIRSLIKKLGKKHTVILSSHVLSEISMICDRVIIINNGKITAIDSPKNLSKNIREYERFFIKVKASKENFIKATKGINGIIKVEDVHSDKLKGTKFSEFIIDSEKNIDVISPLFFALAKNKYVIHEMRQIEVNLEDIFIQYTSENEAEKKGRVS